MAAARRPQRGAAGDSSLSPPLRAATPCCPSPAPSSFPGRGLLGALCPWRAIRGVRPRWPTMSSGLVAQRGGPAQSWAATSFPDVPGALPTRYFVMAGTPEKILEHLLEFMRLDATLYDPEGRGGVTPLLQAPRPRATLRWAGVRVPAGGPAPNRAALFLLFDPKAASLTPKSPAGAGRGSSSGAGSDSAPASLRLPLP